MVWALRWLIMGLNIFSEIQAHQTSIGFLAQEKVNFREGPDANHAILWTYRSPGWPVKILRTYGYWCYVEDFLGAKGWVKRNLLRLQPAYLVLRQKKLHKDPSLQSPLVATLEKGVIVQADKNERQGRWMKVRVYTRDKRDLKGWIEHENLWPK